MEQEEENTGITESGHGKCCYLGWNELCGKEKRKAWASNSRRTGRMEELVDENRACSEVWWSASKSSSCHELSSCSSGQAFFSACNFFITALAHVATFGLKFPVFHWCNAKRWLEQVLDPLGVGALALPLATLTFFNLSFLTVSSISVAPQWPGVFLWEKRSFEHLKQDELPWKELRDWEVLVGNI